MTDIDNIIFIKSPTGSISFLDGPTFEEIWEQDAKWLMGREILSDIVVFLKDKSPIATFEENGVCQISLPLPTLKDVLTGNDVSIFYSVPSELSHLFEDRWSSVLQHRSEFVEDLGSQYVGSMVDERTIVEINHKLHEHERTIRASRGPCIALLAAQAFGVSRLLAL